MNIIYTSNDGLFGVITGADYNILHVNNGIQLGRSKTNKDPQAALNSAWDPNFSQPVGPGSLANFVKVRLSDIPGQARPAVILSPGNYTAKPKKIISNYPHTCHVCGGKMLILFSSVEHEGGACPGAKPKLTRW